MSNTVEVTVIPFCDFCGIANALYDAKTIHGPWANQCQRCFDLNGIGLGLGRGQKLTIKK